MQTILVLHNLVRWLILLFGFWAIINAISGLTGKRPYSANDNRSNLLFMIFCDIQLLLGLILYFNNGWFNQLTSNAKVVMKDAALRFYTVEHTLMMILAIILVHIGRSSVKRASTDSQKHKRMLVYFGIAMLLILAAIPWPFRAGIGRPWFMSF
ncbi:MAG: cytochrome b [Chitinophagaceae bacterium]|mgnify:CR=1 FL=1|nr:cytochrome B [Bacteroidota bacterium]MCC6258116.1 cytochrome b [Chitinophagaceae bacterium]MCW5917033.1 hypothetical protein [Ferruginibacter sp.]